MITIEGNANDCLALAAKLEGYTSFERININKYIFVYTSNKEALKALVYLWKQIKGISDKIDGMSNNRKMLFFKLSFAYVNKED